MMSSDALRSVRVMPSQAPKSSKPILWWSLIAVVHVLREKGRVFTHSIHSPFSFLMLRIKRRDSPKSQVWVIVFRPKLLSVTPGDGTTVGMKGVPGCYRWVLAKWYTGTRLGNVT